MNFKLGLDSYSYHLAFGAHPDFKPRRRLTLFAFIERVAKLRLDGFQIDPMHLGSRDRAYLAEVRAAATAQGLFLEFGAIGTDPRRLARDLHVAARLGSPVLRTFVGCDRHDRRTNLKAEIRRAVAGLREVRSLAADLRIRLGVENHGDLTTDELLEVVGRVDSPWVGVCLDVGNAMLTGEDPLAATRRLAPYAVTTHFKDYALQPTNYGAKIAGVTLGEGLIDLPAVLRVIRRVGRLDRIVLELPIEAQRGERAALLREDQCVRQSIRYMRRALGLGRT
jgi:sugar phosphate isomerase/epimerase